MNKNNKSITHSNQDDSFVLVPRPFLNRLEEKIDYLTSKFEEGTKVPASIHGFISERQAVERFKRSHTWFWEQRKSGLLPFSRVGKTIYYTELNLSKIMQSDTNPKC